MVVALSRWLPTSALRAGRNNVAYHIMFLLCGKKEYVSSTTFNSCTVYRYTVWTCVFLSIISDTTNEHYIFIWPIYNIL